MSYEEGLSGLLPDDGWRVVCEDCVRGLRGVPDECVHSVVTSPPYFMMRDYGTSEQIGHVRDMRQYLDRLSEVFAEVRRVMRRDAVLWLNLSDSYAKNRRNGAGVKAKELIGVPWRVAFRLQEDGFYLRSDVVWEKLNCKPESVRDRVTRSHEYVFMLTKSPSYFYDKHAILEPYTFGPLKGNGGAGRNKRSVWSIPTTAFRGEHHAPMPLALAETCILASTSGRGCCPACGDPWERMLERSKEPEVHSWGKQRKILKIDRLGKTSSILTGRIYPQKSVGWRPTCGCSAGSVSCLVLDPFCGSGTTGVSAVNLHRRFLGIDNNEVYCRLARQRIKGSERPKGAFEPD